MNLAAAWCDAYAREPEAPPELPSTCVAFLESWYGLTLTCGQRTFVRVAIDRVPLDDLEPEERAVALEMFGDLTAANENAWRTIVAACGRDSGKTELGAGIALFLLLSVDISDRGPGDIPRGFVVAPDKDTAALTVERAVARIEASDQLRSLLDGKPNVYGFKMRRLDGRFVKLEVRSASRGGKSMRGRSIIVLIMDEAAFFTSDGFVINDAEIVRAVRPRIVKGGRIVMLSTLWIEEGLFYDLYQRNREVARTAIVAHAPSLVMRDQDPDLAERIALEREDDEENADREYFCILSSSGSTYFFDAELLKACINDNRDETLPFDARFPHHAAGDLGFRRNSSSVTIVRDEGPMAKVVYLEERRPKKGAPLVPSEVCQGFGLACASYGTFDILLDYESIESAREHFSSVKAADPRDKRRHAGERGISISEFNPNTEMAETCTRVRTMMREGRVELPRHRRLIQQLRGVKFKKLQGGKTSIIFPSVAGAHGDVAASAIMALGRASAENDSIDLKKAMDQVFSKSSVKAKSKRSETATADDMREMLGR